EMLHVPAIAVRRAVPVVPAIVVAPSEAVAVFQEWGIRFTPVGPGDSLGGWRTPEILSPGLIIPGRFRRLTSGSAATPPAANISGACAGRVGSYARIAGGRASRG